MQEILMKQLYNIYRCKQNTECKYITPLTYTRIIQFTQLSYKIWKHTILFVYIFYEAHTCILWMKFKAISRAWDQGKGQNTTFKVNRKRTFYRKQIMTLKQICVHHDTCLDTWLHSRPNTGASIVNIIEGLCSLTYIFFYLQVCPNNSTPDCAAP